MTCRATPVTRYLTMGAIVCVSAVSVAAQSSRPVITVHRPRIPESVLRYRRLLQKERPPLRGFRAPILDNAGERWPFRPPDDSGPIRQAADLVGRRLARDGLLATLARVLDILGPSSLPVADGDVLDLLRAVGLPVDLLPCFSFDDKNVSAAAIDVVRYIRRRLKAGATVNNLGDELGTATFRFRRSREDFRASTESGERAIGTIRLQLPTGTDWRGPGDGAAVDVARQLVTRLPDVSFLVDINEAHVDAFLSLARSWPLNRPGRLTAIVEPMPVAQWAQDNGKPGLVGPPDAPQIATLVPRYASRGEDGSIFVPDETFVADGLAATGHTVIQSPLIFQGGNLMSVRDPATGERIMLIGEAEVYRNTALGLTREQVIGAFKTEFAVDRCVVLPAVSFHIDFEVCVRAVGNRLVAFVNDTPAAVRIILGLGIDALVSHGSLDAGAARRGREHLAAGRLNELLAVIGPSVGRSRNRSGHFPNSLARHFARGPVDSGAANLQRFMLAMDLVTAGLLRPAEMPDDRFAAAFMRSLQRRTADRKALHRQLADLGWRVVPVPSLADDDRSINYLNGIHGRDRYVIPAYGGFYAPLDAAAAEVFRNVLGPQVDIVPILCGASQRNFGAVHCAVAVYEGLRD